MPRRKAEVPDQPWVDPVGKVKRKTEIGRGKPPKKKATPEPVRKPAQPPPKPEPEKVEPGDDYNPNVGG